MKFKLQMVAVEADGKENNVQEITLLGEYKKRGARLPIYDLEAHADQSLDTICEKPPPNRH